MATVVPYRNPLIESPFVDADIERYSEVPTLKEWELRESAVVIERRASLNEIAESERIGELLKSFDNTEAAWASVAGGTGSVTPTYDATAGHSEGTHALKLAYAGAASKSARVAYVKDLSEYSGGAKIRIRVKASTVTDLTSVNLQFWGPNSTNRVTLSIVPTTSWVEYTFRKGAPSTLTGDMDWSDITELRIGVVSGATYTGNIWFDDLRIGYPLTWEDTYDLRVRYFDDADPKLTFNLPPPMGSGTTLTLSPTTDIVVGDVVSIASGNVVNVRTVLSKTANSITFSPALDTDADWTGSGTVSVIYPGPWSERLEFKVSQPPVVTLVAPTEAATVTDPTPLLDWSYSSPGGKLQTTYQLDWFKRVGTDDQQAHTSGEVESVLTAYTLPAFLHDIADATYAWEVTACDSEGLCTTMTRATYLTDFAVPSAPANLTATADPSITSNEVAWTTSADVNLQGHYLYRKRAQGGWDDGTFIAAGTNAYTDRAAGKGQNEYRLTASTGVTGLESEEVSASADLASVEPFAVVIAEQSVTGRLLELPFAQDFDATRAQTRNVMRALDGSTTVIKSPAGRRSGSIRSLILHEDQDQLDTLEELAELDDGVYVKNRTGAVYLVSLAMPEPTPVENGWEVEVAFDEIEE